MHLQTRFDTRRAGFTLRIAPANAQRERSSRCEPLLIYAEDVPKRLHDLPDRTGRKALLGGVRVAQQALEDGAGDHDSVMGVGE
jgi:hypothetical protein